MRRPKTIAVLGHVSMWLALGIGVANADATHVKRQLIGDGSLELRLEPEWSLAKRVAFESETYTVSDRGKSLFSIYLGNNPDLGSIRHDLVRDDRINGNVARRYYVNGSLTDVIVIPRCGHDNYVWLTRTSEMRSSSAQVRAAMASIRCIRATMSRARATLPPL